jgi:hypothetical protein
MNASRRMIFNAEALDGKPSAEWKAIAGDEPFLLLVGLEPVNLTSQQPHSAVYHIACWNFRVERIL